MKLSERAAIRIRKQREAKTVPPFDTRELRRAADRITGWTWTGSGELDPRRLLRNAANEIDRLSAAVPESSDE